MLPGSLLVQNDEAYYDGATGSRLVSTRNPTNNAANNSGRSTDNSSTTYRVYFLCHITTGVVA